jgi:hypothetical protein
MFNIINDQGKETNTTMAILIQQKTNVLLGSGGSRL